MDDETVHFVLEAIDMVATHGWKLLPQVSNKNRLEIAFFIRRLLDNPDSPIYWLTTERTKVHLNLLAGNDLCIRKSPYLTN